MAQIYHNNAVTNCNIRTEIQKSNDSLEGLSVRYSVSRNTIGKWRNRDDVFDKSSRPDVIRYALTPIEKELIKAFRISSWMPLDEIVDICANDNFMPNANRSNISRTLIGFGINKVPIEKRREAKKFKEYQPGYLHIDVTYLPKLAGEKNRKYLFVAIDRSTRVLFYLIYDNKTAVNADDFLDKVIEFFPFDITHILTDNGAEFTNETLRKIQKNKKNKKNKGGEDKNSEDLKNKKLVKDSKFDIKCEEYNIDHRLTKPCTPQTNGMVERVNRTIKDSTIKTKEYKNHQEMEDDLNKFMRYYNFNRRHSSLKKELKVRTPFEAIEEWYKIQPEIFKKTPQEFKDKLLSLNDIYVVFVQQRGET